MDGLSPSEAGFTGQAERSESETCIGFAVSLRVSQGGVPVPETEFLSCKLLSGSAFGSAPVLSRVAGIDLGFGGGT
jgi:hypothetical protein